MRWSKRQTAAAALGSLALFASSTAWPAEAKTEPIPDLAAILRIKEEAFRSGKVMDHLFWLTDANGPRLTCSPGFRSAADWAVRALASWGVANARLEPWGRFGRAWSLQRLEFSLVEP